MEKLLTIQIVGWNSAEVLEGALTQLVKCSDVVVRYIDNNSTDGSVEMVRRILPQADIIELPRNTGFAAAHNMGITECKTEFIMVHNPDLLLEPSSLPLLLKGFDDKSVGAVQGKIVKSKKGNRTIIDSTGIMMTWALNGVDRGEGEVDEGQYEQEKDIAAVTGAAGCYRLSALRQVRDKNGDYYDSDFFAYKEDVDLGWRLRLAGWRCRYLPVRQGTHVRGFGKKQAQGWRRTFWVKIDKIRDRRTRYSLRNWVWMILKNATLKDLFKHELFIDIRLLGFVLLGAVYWPLLGTLAETMRGIPKMMEKRVELENSHRSERG